jgi:fructan beta-fructosidase
LKEITRRTPRRLTASAAVLLLVSACVVLASASPAAAGTVSDYPEFPYPTTNYDEPYRGQYHFSARYGWINDPNGLLYYRGTYHLFSQDNPHGLGSDTKHWGHATSTDLVHWTQKPIALEPDVHPGDLWSGAGVVDANNVSGLKTGDDDPILVFAGTQGVIIHYSTDGAKTFQTFDRGRKVVIPSGESRDPKVFWHAPSNRWVMVVWSAGGGNGANFYTSTDLLNWTFRSRYTAGWFFECPDMFPLPVDGNAANTKWVLTDASGEYVIGNFDGATFQPDWATPQRMDMGANHAEGTFYAGQVFNGVPGGRVVQMAWQPGNHGSAWTGNLTFPAELALRTFPEGIRITRNPIGEITSLRSDPASFVDRTITTSPSSNPLSAISADTYEITAEFDAAGATASAFGLRLHTRANGTYDRQVAYDRTNQTLYGKSLAPVNGRVKMRVLVDRGQLEIFGADGKLSISDNVNFNSAADSQGIQVYAEGGSVRLVSLQFHRLGRSWGVGESVLDSNLAGAWAAVGGSWTDVTAGKQGQAGGDAFYLSSATGADFTYEGDVRVINGTAAALTFRASADGTQHYTANVDTSGLVKLWRPGYDIATHQTPIIPGRPYHLKVVARGANIRVWLGSTEVINASDSTYTSGYFGLNAFNGTAGFQNVTSGAATDPGGARPIYGPGNKCVDVSGSNTANGTPIQIWDCNGSGAQQWTRQGDTLRALGKCLDVVYGGTANGTKVWLWDCNGSGAQVWQVAANSSLRNPQSGRCLDLPNGNTANGNQLQIWDCHGGDNQRWRFG